MKYYKIKNGSFVVVDDERRYFTIVHIIHYKNKMSYNDYMAKRPYEVSITM